ncbi:MAG: S8 family serine peptidase [Deltaproteobacteria bacterium]|nr:S8 family serine peptidase [Deltaproteobacteria bacterium]
MPNLFERIFGPRGGGPEPEHLLEAEPSLEVGKGFPKADTGIPHKEQSVPSPISLLTDPEDLEKHFKKLSDKGLRAQLPDIIGDWDKAREQLKAKSFEQLEHLHRIFTEQEKKLPFSVWSYLSGDSLHHARQSNHEILDLIETAQIDKYELRKKKNKVNEELGGSPLSENTPDPMRSDAPPQATLDRCLSRLDAWNKEEKSTSKYQPTDAFQNYLSTNTLRELIENYKAFQANRFPTNFEHKPNFEQLSSFLSVIRSEIVRKIDEERNSLMGSENIQSALSVLFGRETLDEITSLFKRNSSVAQFSGALQFAHTKGITGEGSPILVCDEMADDFHEFHVSGICKQIAPNSSLSKRPLHNSSMFGAYKILADKIAGTPHPSIPRDSKIINVSLGSSPAISLVPFLSELLKTQALIVKTAGNKGLSLDYPVADLPNRMADQAFYDNLPESKRAQLILSGALDAGNVRASYSNRPGKNPHIYNHFLWTLGSKVLSDVSDTKTQEFSGTSMSAPVVTGAAALVHQILGPDSKAEDLNECLVESAEQDFWVHRPKEVPIHIIGPNAPVPPNVSNVIVRRYEPEYWGKGILNIRRALEYAYLKKHNPDLDSKTIRAVLDQNDKRRENEAATKIQNVFRDYRTRKQPPAGGGALSK